MVARTVLAHLDGGSPHDRLQVSLVPRGDGRLAIDLCEQHYAEGIGWFDQRSLTLDPKQLSQLQAVLGLQAGAIEAVEAEPPATLPFPGPRDVGARRVAAGDRG